MFYPCKASSEVTEQGEGVAAPLFVRSADVAEILNSDVRASRPAFTSRFSSFPQLLKLRKLDRRDVDIETILDREFHGPERSKSKDLT